jgi:UDP-2,3-diacylglucosamine hydrolase
MSDASTTPMAKTNKAQSQAVALFVSDVHLQPALPRTTLAFLDFLRLRASKAQQLYLLGDLFEYWAGDDDIATPYHRQIAGALREVSDAGVAVFWIAGNRDFLIGEEFAKATGMTPLPDPVVVEIAGQRITLVHGDAQCTDDQEYMAFREKVRNPEWQQEFLAIPLAQRKAIIDGMRTGSREAQRSKAYDIMDVNPEAITSLFETTGTQIMIHGHTHRPGKHDDQVNGENRVRHVLPDWDCDTETTRGGWLAINADGTLQRFDIDSAEC